ncbi:MAG TPA: protoporphyrinogen oxidase, partial [Vicinamibacteria bacterium]
ERLVPARRDGADESIATFFRRRFGAEALELLGEPLLAGIHAGDAESLSLRSAMPRLAELERQFGSLSRGMGVSRGRATGPPAPPFYALRGGMMELVRALVERLPASSLRPGCAARALRRRGGEYELETEGGGRILARSVVLALPPPFAQLLLSGLAPQAACMLSLTPVASTATVLLGYRRQDVAHPLDGHGLLVPRSEGLRTTACSFVSSKFAFRAPEGHVLLRAFVGGVRDPGAVSLPAEAALSMVQAELGPLLGIRGLPLVSRVYPWPAAMPQMEVGHATRLAALEESLADFPGLFLTGAGLRGTGIPDGIADGLGTAVQAAGFVEARHAA